MLSLCAPDESFIQYSALSFWSFVNLHAMEQLCFPHPAVMLTFSRQDILSGSNVILPLDSARAEILHFLSHGKGSKHKPQMPEPRLSFGEI